MFIKLHRIVILILIMLISRNVISYSWEYDSNGYHFVADNPEQVCEEVYPELPVIHFPDEFEATEIIPHPTQNRYRCLFERFNPSTQNYSSGHATVDRACGPDKKRIINTQFCTQQCNHPEIYHYVTGTCISPCPEGKEHNALGICVPVKKQPPLCEKPPHIKQSSNHPINFATGEKILTETDYIGGGIFPLQFKRTYTSLREVAPVARMGAGWRNNYDRYIDVYKIDKVVYRPNGQAFTFRNTGNNSWQSDPDVTDRLKKILDENGEFVEWQYYDSNDNMEVYRFDGRLLSISNRAGFTQTLHYDLPPAMGGDGDSRTLDRVSDHFGRALSFEYQDGLMKKFIDPESNEFVYFYDEHDNLVTVQYPKNEAQDASYPTVNYQYDDLNFPNAVTAVIDENNNQFAKFEYDSEGRAILSELNGGVDWVEINYDPAINGPYHYTEVTDAQGETRTYSFAYIQGILRTVDISSSCPSCGNQNHSLVFNPDGYVDSTIDFNGNETKYTFNSRGLETSRVEAFATPLQRTITTEWHPDFRLPTRINEAGLRETINTYDSETGQILSKTVKDIITGETRTTNFSYDINNLPDITDGPRTDVNDHIDYDYDPVSGYLLRTTDQIGNITEVIETDEHGRATVIKDMNSNDIHLTYYPRGWLKSHTITDGHTGTSYTTQYEYDAAGLLDRVVSPEGRVTDYDYDSAQRLTDIKDALGHHIHYELDAMGNRIFEKYFDENGRLSRQLEQQYNTLNRLERILGGTWNFRENSYQYDPNGNLVKAFDGKNQETQYDYDALNRISRISHVPTNTTTVYQYDSLDNLVSVTDPEQQETLYSRNAYGEVLIQNSPDTGITSMTYDSAGNIKTKIDANGNIGSYEYYANNVLRNISYQDGSYIEFDIPVGYGNDSTSVESNTHGRISKQTSLQIFTDNQESLQSDKFAYDIYGNVVRHEFSLNTSSYTIEYEYDLDGNLVKMLYPSGREVEFILNANGRPVNTISNYQESSIELIDDSQSVSYYPFGPLHRLTYKNSVIYTQYLNRDYRPISYGYRQGNSIFYYYNRVLYDKNSNIRGIYNIRNSGLSSNFTYDSLDRLRGVIDDNDNYEFEYDDNGNRTSLNLSGNFTEYLIQSNSNRIQEITSDEGTTILDYDSVGNSRNRGYYNFQYNEMNRLETVENNSVEISRYSYDANSRRIHKASLMSGNMTFIYDVNNQLIAEIDEFGNSIREYIYWENSPMVMFDGDNNVPYFYAKDHLHTPHKLIDDSGNIAWSAIYTPFGEATINSDSIVTQPLRYPGQYYDEETGLHYNWHRYYDPTLGRYITSDPIGINGGLNTYAYADGNPIVRIDVRGLAYFMLRPLGGVPWIPGLSCNEYLGRYNVEVSHEQLFFEDGKSPSNLGFFDDNQVRPEDEPRNISQYRCRRGKFNDCIMRKAVANVPGGGYCLLGAPGVQKKNCQDWAEAVREEYRHLASDPSIVSECNTCSK